MTRSACEKLIFILMVGIGALSRPGWASIQSPCPSDGWRRAGAVYTLTDETATLMKTLGPIMQLAENEVPTRGNGDAVLFPDGSLRFVDTLEKSELDKIAGKRAPERWFNRECTPDSISSFQLDDPMMEEYRAWVNAMVSQGHIRLAMWLGHGMTLFLSKAVFSDYLFPVSETTWTENTRIPKEFLIPVDFHTGLVSVINRPVYNRLSRKDRLAAIIHASLRQNASDYDGRRPLYSVDQIEEATERLIKGNDVGSVEKMFHLDEAQTFEMDLERIGKASEEIASVMRQNRAPDPKKLARLAQLVDASYQHTFGQASATQAILKSALEVPDMNRYMEGDRDSHGRYKFDQWELHMSRFNGLIAQLDLVNGASPELKKVIRDVKRTGKSFLDRYKTEVSVAAGNTFARDATEPKARELLNLLMGDVRSREALCPYLDSIFAVDPTEVRGARN